MPFTRIELCVFSVIDEELVVLLGLRQSAPFKGKWALPGGALRIDLDETLEAAAQRVAAERIRRDLPYLRQQCAVGGKGRDIERSPWALSVVYRALVPASEPMPPAGKRLEKLQWFSADQACRDPGLAFDHAQLISMATSALRQEIERLDIPFGFLQPTFTLAELQQFCEQLLARKLDKSSFRRRLDDRQAVELVPGEFRGGANRPAQLYRSSGHAARA
jgi:ADP-ribose pyrophosphatase YjhB (NUDIX family)